MSNIKTHGLHLYIKYMHWMGRNITHLNGIPYFGYGSHVRPSDIVRSVCNRYVKWKMKSHCSIKQWNELVDIILNRCDNLSSGGKSSIERSVKIYTHSFKTKILIILADGKYDNPRLRHGFRYDSDGINKRYKRIKRYKEHKWIFEDRPKYIKQVNMINQSVKQLKKEMKNGKENQRNS